MVVSDDGPGIPAAFRTAAFDRFVRLGGGGGTEGSGLGLAIVQSAAARLNAAITFDDTEDGLSVRVAFPRAAA